MIPFTLTSILTLALVPGGQALVRFRNVADICSGKCRADFGWPGHPFPNDPWGLIMDPKLMSSSSSLVATDPAPPTVAGGVEASPSSRSDITFTGFPSFSSSVSFPSPALILTPSSVSTSLSAPASTSKLSSTEVASHTNSTSPTSKKPLPTSSIASSPPPQLSPSPSPQLSSSPPPPSYSPSLLSSTSSSFPSASPPPPSLVKSNNSGIPNANPGNSSADSGSPTSQSDIQAYLSGHNTVRTLHRAAPLTYSQDLAAKAQQWANGCAFTHSGGKLGALGENLAAGTGDGYSIPQAIKSWTDEASQYDPGNPQPSHFTQVVWKGTTQVGCALQNCDGIFPSSYGKAHFYVCEYSPQGNIIGEFGANVQV